MPRATLRGAFTLVELLVVVALVATLAAMLFPVFVQAKGAAKGTGCVGNLRSIGLGVGLYCSDNESRYPLAVDPSRRYSQVEPLRKDLPLLSSVLVPYVRARNSWRCPIDSGVPPLRPENDDQAAMIMLAGTSPSVFERYGSSYSYDDRLGTEGVTDPPTLYDPEARVEHGASEVPIVQDLSDQWHGTQADPKANVLFADGHLRVVGWPENAQSGAWSTPQARR